MSSGLVGKSKPSTKTVNCLNAPIRLQSEQDDVRVGDIFLLAGSALKAESGFTRRIKWTKTSRPKKRTRDLQHCQLSFSDLLYRILVVVKKEPCEGRKSVNLFTNGSTRVVQAMGDGEEGA